MDGKSVVIGMLARVCQSHKSGEVGGLRQRIAKEILLYRVMHRSGRGKSERVNVYVT